MTEDLFLNLKDDNFLKYYYDNSGRNPENKDPMFSIAYNPYRELFTVSYVHAGIDFTKHENRIARGLTIDKNGEIVLIGFEKFFNWMQFEDRDIDERFKEEFTHLDPNAELKCREKLDGTMIILGAFEDGLIASTTSNTSKRLDKDGVIRENFWANHADEYFNNHKRKEEIVEYLKRRNSCFVFEWIAPENQIVVTYDREDFVLLAETDKATHKRIQPDNTFGFTLPKEEMHTVIELEKIQREREDIEGFVVENKYGNLIKIKTDYWFDHHYDMFMFNLTTLNKNILNNIIDAYFQNTIDDMLAIQNQNELWRKKDLIGIALNKLEEILDYMKKYGDSFETIREFAESDLKHKNLLISYQKAGKDINSLNDKAIIKIKQIVREELQAEGLCKK